MAKRSKNTSLLIDSGQEPIEPQEDEVEDGGNAKVIPITGTDYGLKCNHVGKQRKVYWELMRLMDVEEVDTSSGKRIKTGKTYKKWCGECFPHDLKNASEIVAHQTGSKASTMNKMFAQIIQEQQTLAKTIEQLMNNAVGGQ